MVAYSHVQPRHRSRSGSLHWNRLPLAAAVIALVAGIDLPWKSAALAAGHGWLDTPTSLVRPLGALLVGLLALTAVLLVPRLCLPGVLLVVGGSASNIASLAVWRAVPNPLGFHIAGGVVHFNLADLCVYCGGLLFLAAAYWTIWRMPAERFAELFARGRRSLAHD